MEGNLALLPEDMNNWRPQVESSWVMGGLQCDLRLQDEDRRNWNSLAEGGLQPEESPEEMFFEGLTENFVAP